MDLSSGFDITNPYGLLAADFNFDTDGYAVALKFLSDLAGGTLEAKALEGNGGNRAMLTAWKGNAKFRRVYEKCKAAGKAAREALRAAEKAQEATEGEGVPNPSGQRFVPFEEGLANLEASGHRAFSWSPSREAGLGE